MAEKSMAYDHPAYTVRQIAPVSLPAGSAGASIYRFVAFTNIRVKRVDAIVRVAGTADAAGYDLLRGTSSIGSVGMGTGAAASLGTAYVGDIALTSGQYLDIKTKAASATLAADAAIEFTLDPGANVTV